jgi:hypothetical protein
MRIRRCKLCTTDVNSGVVTAAAESIVLYMRLSSLVKGIRGNVAVVLGFICRDPVAGSNSTLWPPDSILLSVKIPLQVPGGARYTRVAGSGAFSITRSGLLPCCISCFANVTSFWENAHSVGDRNSGVDGVGSVGGW